jgi:hypothetical protein
MKLGGLVRATGEFCQGVNADGHPCQARRISGSKFRFFHAPEQEQARRAARKAGGLKNKKAVLPRMTPDLQLLSTQDVEKLLAVTINEVRRGEVDSKVANGIGYLSAILVKSLQETEFDSRLTALEAAVKARA